MKPPILLLLPALLSLPIAAQKAPANGPRQVETRWHAFVHATLLARPGSRIQDATIVIRDGRILQVTKGAAPPAGARVWDCTGLTVHAGFLDPHVAVQGARITGSGAHWNPKVLAQRSPLDGPGLDAKSRKELRGLGFTAAAITPKDGIFRGFGSVVLLDEPDTADGVPSVSIVSQRAYHSLAFERSGGGYPRSLMGVIALTRQTLLDAEWYAKCAAIYAHDSSRHEPPQVNAALAALGTAERDPLPLLFSVRSANEALAANRIGREMHRATIVMGNGTDYRRLEALREDGSPLVLPLNFPSPPKLDSGAAAEAVSLRELMAWEQAPTNPRRVVRAGIPAMLTTDGLAKRGDFLKNLRKAREVGLTEDEALAMLTVTPAGVLGVADRLGTVEPGKLANLVLTDGPLFEEKSIRSVWIRGRRYPIHPRPAVQVDGSWTLQGEILAGRRGTLQISEGKKIVLEHGTEKLTAKKVQVSEGEIDFVLVEDGKVKDGKVKDGKAERQVALVHALVEGARMFGRTRGPDGSTLIWTAMHSPVTEASHERIESKIESEDLAEVLPTPFGAYGLTKVPPQTDLLVKNATIWTEGRRGILHHATMLVVKGKVAFIGPDEGMKAPPGTRVLDARGRHITPGLIDCHNHSGISGGVNEGTQAVTSEVRVGDVVNPDDIALYRELAGGVTTINQLHGSANPIGGQNSVIKLRWGVMRPRDMHLLGAPPGIKFALGENVKRSNSSQPQTRYPASRMGVETIMRDRFTAAREYAAAWRRYQALRSDERAHTLPPRRDLELEALAEILAGQRLVHCHSYRQDEILMLCRIGKDFGFKIGTFQHGLECYKVAEAVKQSARGASIFSDWWAYKVEVVDAIPQAGPILHEVGIPVSYNSDSNEQARRLNTEAAKAVKYGGLEPAEALKFVTYNPALQLGLQDRIGSLEIGKDADFVIWSGDPLSSMSRCEATFIDGREYFSREQDQAMRRLAASERRRLITKVLLGKEPGKEKEKPQGHADHETSCHEIEEVQR